MNKPSKFKTIESESWEFIDLIYETAHDPEFWPLALEGLKVELDSLKEQINEKKQTQNCENLPTNLISAELTSNLNSPVVKKTHSVINSTSSLNNTDISKSEIKLINKLAPHFNRALNINRSYQSLKDKADVALSLLDRIPIGIVFTNQQGNVITLNSFASTLINSGKLLVIKNNFIQTTNHDTNKQLQAMISNVHAYTDKEINEQCYVLKFPKSNNDDSLSVLVTPHIIPNLLVNQEKRVVLFVVSDNSKFKINEKALASIFGLSVTEAIIAKHIASGKTLIEYCESHGVTQHTVRSQLKSVFNKTNTHSQSELSNRILTSPAFFIAPKNVLKNKNISKSVTNNNLPNFSPDDKQFITLPDGRSLCYVDVGDKNGIPVLLCHGNYGCRKERYPDDRIATELGIRLIVPDRPGFGLSTKIQTQTGLEWSDDFNYLLDYLGIKKLHLLSTGTGSYFALSCADKYPDKITGLTLVNSIAPFKSINEFQGIIRHEKLSYAMARYTPSLYKRFVELSYLGFNKNFDWYFNSVKTYGRKNNKEYLNDETLATFIKDKVFTAFENSVAGCIQETILLANQWEIDLTSIKTKVDIYHGGNQVAIPLSMSKRLDSFLPNSQYHYLPDQGYYFIYLEWRSLLKSIKSLELNK